MAINATEIYNLVTVSMALAFIHGHVDVRKQE